MRRKLAELASVLLMLFVAWRVDVSFRGEGAGTFVFVLLLLASHAYWYSTGRASEQRRQLDQLVEDRYAAHQAREQSRPSAKN
jgi:uncharacterized membrane protein YqjE